MRKIIILIILSLLSTASFTLENPYPENPTVPPQSGDQILITAEDGITVGMLREALLVKELWPGIWTYVNDCLTMIDHDDKTIQALVATNIDLKQKVDYLKTQRNILIGCAGLFGTLALVFGISAFSK